MIESTTLNVDAEISKLSQQAGETLGTYYKKANSLLIQARSRDRETPLMTIGEVLKGNFAPLSPSENTVLDSVIRAFIRGISDTIVRVDTLRGLVATQRSLKGAYTIAEKSKKLNEELVLMEKLEQEQNELEFLRQVVKDRVSSEPILELMKSYTRHYSCSQPLTIHAFTRLLSSPENNSLSHKHHSSSEHNQTPLSDTGCPHLKVIRNKTTPHQKELHPTNPTH